MQTQRRSVAASSDASYCERETADDWGSRSSLSQLEEVMCTLGFLATGSYQGIVGVSHHISQCITSRCIKSHQCLGKVDNISKYMSRVITKQKDRSEDPAVAGARDGGEPPRSTAYYYADLERLKRKNPDSITDAPQDPDQLSEYVESNKVANEGGVREIPPLRDRQWSLPEYSTPENSRKMEYTPENSRKIDTYSTAGTFPMPEAKEKEPLLAELEVVGRLPLSQLDSAAGVRRSRSWYLCCPNVADEEMSRESSWRYSSLRPVTAPPAARQNGLVMTATQSSGGEHACSVRAERDALARALAAERARAASAARAHDARLAELHGVIAELVRRRAHDQHARAIPEEELSDECESTTQPAGELDDGADSPRSEQNDTASTPSPPELPAPRDARAPPPAGDDTAGCGAAPRTEEGAEQPCVEVSSPTPSGGAPEEPCDTSLDLSERGLGTARWRAVRSAGGSCERERGSPDAGGLHAGRCESRQAKLASRVRLRKTEDSDSTNQLAHEESWCAEAAERLAMDVCAHADLREALVAATNDGCCAAAWRARCARLEADVRVAQCAFARAMDTAHRLYSACGVQESRCVAVCCALRAADRALEAYDVLLALAETQRARAHEREAAELVARQLLARLDAEQSSVSIGEPLLSPGPWLQHHNQARAERWSAECEARLRAHAARLKADTVALRGTQPPPALFSYHDVQEEEEDVAAAEAGEARAREMEAAVALQDALAAAERGPHPPVRRGACPAGAPHWLDAPASETDL